MKGKKLGILLTLDMPVVVCQIEAVKKTANSVLSLHLMALKIF